jgi:diguanylate cyclase (GGDEF)-like protein/PAS domain S-box-containing protein
MKPRSVDLEIFQEAIEKLAQGVLIHDRDGRISYCNDSAQRILGLPCDQIVGHDSPERGWDMLHDDGSEYPYEIYPSTLTLRDGRPVRNVRMGIRKASGDIAWIEINTTPLLDAPDGRIKAVITTFHDVTLRRELEAQLRESQLRFRQFAENIDLVLWIGTPDWRTVDYVSPAFETIWGLPAATLYANGMAWLESVIEEDRPALLNTIAEQAQGDWQSIVFPPYRIRKPDDGLLWIAARAFPIRNAEGGIERVAGIAEDISMRHQQQEHLEDLAHVDPLTRLPNRTLLADRMHQAMARSRRTGEMLAVCLLDLDGFKQVNDQLGHKAGDSLLIQLAGRLIQTVRADDTVARLGGDEFVLLLGSVDSVGKAEEALSRVLKVIETPFRLGDQNVRVSASIGITLFPNDGGDADTLLRHADHAMYLAKEGGKNQYHQFNPTLEIRDRENREALERIERALHQGQFILHYQPIVDCLRSRPTGVEALIRWNHPILGLLTPNEFLPLIEGHDQLALEVGAWAAESAIAQAEAWQQSGIDLRVSINVFPQQFRDMDFTRRIEDMLARRPALPPGRITLEIVESSALEDVVSASRLMKEGERLGICYALDDFGTGYSSMTYLRRLAVNTLKIDQSFVHDMLTDPEDLAIIEAIIGLASAFRHHVIAEGVETLDQILMLNELGCHLIQGYALAHPMPADEIPGWLLDFTPDPRWRVNASQHLSRDDFQLILAEVHHRQWLHQLQGWYRQDVEQRGDPPPLEPELCSFGRWHAGEGLQRYGHLPEFHATTELHQRVHALAHQIVVHRLAGTSDGCQDREAAMLDASETFISALIGLRRTVGSPGKQTP